MESRIRKWGNGLAVRLPAAAIEAAAFSLEQKVTLRVTRGRIIIEPSDELEYTLDDLLNRITAQNLHGEATFDCPTPIASTRANTSGRTRRPS
jgi:antitoxin MazE